MANRESAKRIGVYVAAIGTAAFGAYQFVQNLPIMPQFLHDITCNCISKPEAVSRYGSLVMPYPLEPITYFVGAGALLAIGRMGRFHEDWNSLKNFTGQIQSKISSEVVNPIKEKILRININYLPAMGYSEI